MCVRRFAVMASLLWRAANVFMLPEYPATYIRRGKIGLRSFVQYLGETAG
jgi:hypothetical protein